MDIWSGLAQWRPGPSGELNTPCPLDMTPLRGPHVPAQAAQSAPVYVCCWRLLAPSGATSDHCISPRAKRKTHGEHGSCPAQV